MILIGIDPGTNTGYATWDAKDQVLFQVQSLRAHQAMERVRVGAASRPGDVLVIIEDARLQRVYRGATFGDVNRLQGAGSVKRDCAIWEEMLTDLAIPFILRKPKASGTKWDAERFKLVTKWPGRTNNHGRDAALLVYGINMAMAGALLAEWKRNVT